jgi:hypothetical protein
MLVHRGGGKSGVIERDLLLLLRSLRSVWTLQLLLTLWRAPARSWGAEELVLELRASDVVVRESLRELVSLGLARAEDQCRYCLDPTKPALADMVGRLDLLYRERQVSVIEAIFARPDDALQNFSSAFKLKKD